MPRLLANVVNVSECEERVDDDGEGWRTYSKRLTLAMGTASQRLGARLTRVPSGQSACPFHTHQSEDEVFFVLAGRGVLRYGADIEMFEAGDFISCPAGTGNAHQLANPFDADLVYLAVGVNDSKEVCTYPDSGKIYVRSLDQNGRLATASYMDGEACPPRIFDLVSQL